MYGFSKPTPQSGGPVAFASFLHSWRTAAALKMEDAAKQIGVASSTWSHWENGRRFPSGQNLVLLSQFTGVRLPCMVCDEFHSCDRLQANR